MFTQNDCQAKLERFLQDKTGTNFSNESQQESFSYEVEAEREYVLRLKSQRQKIEALYSKYDILLNELKNKDLHIKEKDRKILELENKCRTHTLNTEESSLLRHQTSQIKMENYSLQQNLTQLEQQYTVLHSHFKNKQFTATQKIDQKSALNEQLINKIRAITKKCEQKDAEMREKSKEMVLKFEEYKMQVKIEKNKLMEEVDLLRGEVLKKQEEINTVYLDNECLKEKLFELESYTNQLAQEYQEKVQRLSKEKKMQMKTAKGENAANRQIIENLEKKLGKFKDQLHASEISLSQLKFLFEEQEKRTNQSVFLLKQQNTQERNSLKEQLIYCENHISKLERKLSECLKKQKELLETVRKYEACMDAKRNLRQIERVQLQKINMLLSLE